MLDLQKALETIESQNESSIDTSKGKSNSGVALVIVELLKKASVDLGRDKITLSPSMLGMKYFSKQTIYNALNSLGIAQANENNSRLNYPCSFTTEKEKPSSTVTQVTVWDLQKIKV